MPEGSGNTMPPMMPPHPGLDMISDNYDDLKKKCPAFASGCPYAKTEEFNTLAASVGDISKCPAFQEGCPFSDKSKEELAVLIESVPKEHPLINPHELPSCHEGELLVQALNAFLSQIRQESDIILDGHAHKQADAIEFLEDPQLAGAMREGTKAVHKAAENSVFTKRFLRGQINRDEYGRYINSLYFVYNSMEALLEKHKEHPTVKLIYFPTEVNRKQSLLQDLEYYYGKDQVPDLIALDKMTPAVREYVDAMESACAKNPALLIAHSYSRYLGDLSGGQILAKRLKTHIFHLSEKDAEWDTTEGLNFYHFEAIGNVPEFKEMYRERLNAARVDAATRDLVVTEAVKSFQLNIALFDEVEELSQKKLLAPTLLRGEIKFPEPAELPKSHEKRSKKSWTIATSVAVAVAAVAVGALIYKRVQKA
ncbi:heme oxygenase-domain-containing protein [Umbelopsis sp. AD052]|nr:heme oxygenase-domain-containing protein [Umbelopsis sp. AD052]